MTKPYLLGESELATRIDEMVEATFEDLTSQFMLLPRGNRFLTYDAFLAGYEALRISTDGFRDFDTAHIWDALRKNARALLVVRSILGVSPPEWQDLACELTNVEYKSNWTRTLDGNVKAAIDYFTAGAGRTTLSQTRVTGLLETAVAVIGAGAQKAPHGLMHRLEKIDTMDGLASVEYVSQHDVPYAVLLYERFLGRPFASHRDAVSELVGDVMESAIEEQLAVARIPFRKTRRAERVTGFDQAPDFFAPDELAPTVIIEAKITGDDGTARDKVARILRLANMRDERLRDGRPAFQVVACVDGRGFGVRRQDMRDMLTATKGKVFTASNLGDLVLHTDLSLLLPGGSPQAAS